MPPTTSRAGSPDPQRDDVARNLLRGREYTRTAGRGATIAALRSALRPWDGLFRYTVWPSDVRSTFFQSGQGRSHERTVEAFGRALQRYGEAVHAKFKTGCAWDAERYLMSSGWSRTGGSRDVECIMRTALFCDSDSGLVPKEQARAVMGEIGSAHILSDSSSHTTDRPRWHLRQPLALALQIPEMEGRVFEAWKADWYRPRLGWLLGVFSELIGLPCNTEDARRVGFDASTRRLLQIEYPGCRRTEDAPPREVEWREGPALDWAAALAATGFTEEEVIGERKAGRRAKRRVFGEAGPSEAGDHPLVAALDAAGWLLPDRGPDWRGFRCIWADQHTGGDISGTKVFTESGVPYCHHDGCEGRLRQSDVVAALPEAARAAYEREQAARKDTIGVRRLRAQLAEADERQKTVTVADLDGARAVLAEEVTRHGEGPRLYLFPEGAGKTGTTLRALVPVAAKQVVRYAVPTHQVAEANADLTRSLGAETEQWYGITSPRHGQESACVQLEAARAIADAGGLPSLLCVHCPVAEQEGGCPARQPDGHVGRAGFVHVSHQLAPRFFAATTGMRSTVVVDEGFPIVRTDQYIRGGRMPDVLDYLQGYGVLGKVYQLRVEPWVTILARLLEEPCPDVEYDTLAEAHTAVYARLEAIAEEYATAPIGPGLRTGWEVMRYAAQEQRGDFEAVEVEGSSALAAAQALTLSVAAKTTGWRPAIAPKAVRAMLDGHTDPRVLDAFKLFEPINRAALPAHAVYRPLLRRIPHLGLQVLSLTDLATAVKLLEDVILLDARPVINHLQALMPDLAVTEIHVGDAAPISRTIVYRSDSGKRKVIPNGQIEWSLVTPVLADLFNRARVAGVRSLLVVTFLAIDKAVARGDSPVQPLIDEWLAEGRTLAPPRSKIGGPFRHYGELRSVNDFEAFDGFATVFDHRPNTDDFALISEYLGESEDQAQASQLAATAGELAQAHGRSRAVTRSTPCHHWHFGRVAPGGWTASNTNVEVGFMKVEKPAPADAADRLRALVEHFGSLRMTAKVLECGFKSLARYVAGERPVPPVLSSRIAQLLRRVCPPSLLRNGNVLSRECGHSDTDSVTVGNDNTLPLSATPPAPEKATVSANPRERVAIGARSPTAAYRPDREPGAEG